MRKALESLFKFLWISTSIFLVVSWCSTYIDPKLMWPAAFVSLLFPYIFIVAGISALFGLILKKNISWLVLTLLIFFSSGFRRSFFNFSIIDTKKSDFKIMSYNIGSSIRGNIKPSWEWYKKIDADIIFFQEWNEPTTALQIKDSIKKSYPYSTLPHTLKTSFWPIFSKYPIVRGGVLKSVAKGNGSTWADVVIQSDTFRVFNVHLISNRISNQTENLLAAKEINYANNRSRIVNVFRRFKNAAMLRTGQAKELKEHINQSPYPTMIVGDFNDIPSSYVYRMLSEGYEDAFLTAGQGMAYTYAGKLPYLSIDHMLYTAPLQCIQLKIPRVHYSDHFPIVGEFVFTKK